MIFAVFDENDRYKVASGLWQYAFGQSIAIQGLKLPSVVSVDFSLDKTGLNSEPRIGVTKDGITEVPIPDSFLINGNTTSDYTVYVFISIINDKTGNTEYRIDLPIKSRPKPKTDNKNPEDAQIFREAMRVVSESAVNARESEKQAKLSADNAREDAVKTDADRKAVEELVKQTSNISAQVEEVKQNAQKAVESAQNAKASETNASTSETNAKTSEAKASASETNAKASEQAVEQAKTSVDKSKQAVDETVARFNQSATEASQALKNEKEAHLKAITSAGASETKKVTDEGTKQVKAVQDTGTAETGKVTSEGTKQVEAVKTEAEKHLQTIIDVTNGIAADRKQIWQNKADVTQLKEANAQLKNEVTGLANDVNALKATKTGKLYGVKKWKSSINPTSTCEKTRDNVGLVCEPSTDKETGRDDYADIPLFQWRRCNYKRYDDGFAYPIAFEGDSDYNDKDNADVGNIYQTFWYNEIDMGDYTELIISDSPNYQLGLRPWEEAVRADGTIMPYFIFSAYTASAGSDGKWYSLPNKKELGFCSHNLMIDNFQKKGKGYWGASVRRNTFAMIFSQIKYATKDIQSVMAGCTNYNFQYKASIQSESKNAYFPVTKAQANNIVVGAYVSVGYGQAKSDKSVNLGRGITSMSVYGDMVKVLRVEDLDGTNSAVYLECEPFNTMPVQDKSVTDVMCEIVMSSMPWWTGSTDSVIGHHDGSINNKSGKYPCRIQGIEYMTGRYQISSDTVMIFQPDYSKDVYLANRGVAHSKSDSAIKETYEKIGNIPASANGKGDDYWVGDVTIKKGAWFPSTELATSQSYGDKLYSGGTSTSGSREYSQGGHLVDGSFAGLACLVCGFGLDGAHWHCAVAD